MRSSRQVEMSAHRPAVALDSQGIDEDEAYYGYTEAGYPVSRPGPGEGTERGERVLESLMMAAFFVGFMFLDHKLERDRDKRRAKMWHKYKR